MIHINESGFDNIDINDKHIDNSDIVMADAEYTNNMAKPDGEYDNSISIHLNFSKNLQKDEIEDTLTDISDTIYDILSYNRGVRYLSYPVFNMSGENPDKVFVWNNGLRIIIDQGISDKDYEIYRYCVEDLKSTGLDITVYIEFLNSRNYAETTVNMFMSLYRIKSELYDLHGIIKCNYKLNRKSDNNTINIQIGEIRTDGRIDNINHSYMGLYTWMHPGETAPTVLYDDNYYNKTAVSPDILSRLVYNIYGKDNGEVIANDLRLYFFGSGAEYKISYDAQRKRICPIIKNDIVFKYDSGSLLRNIYGNRLIIYDLSGVTVDFKLLEKYKTILNIKYVYEPFIDFAKTHTKNGIPNLKLTYDIWGVYDKSWANIINQDKLIRGMKQFLLPLDLRGCGVKNLTLCFKNKLFDEVVDVICDDDAMIATVYEDDSLNESAFDEITIEGDYINDNDIIMADNELIANNNINPTGEYERELAFYIMLRKVPHNTEAEIVRLLTDVRNIIVDTFNYSRCVKYISEPTFRIGESIFSSNPPAKWHGLNICGDWNTPSNIDKLFDDTYKDVDPSVVSYNILTYYKNAKSCNLSIKVTLHSVDNKEKQIANAVKFLVEILDISKTFDDCDDRTMSMDCGYVTFNFRNRTNTTRLDLLNSGETSNGLRVFCTLYNWMYMDGKELTEDEFYKIALPKIAAFDINACDTYHNIQDVFSQYAAPRFGTIHYERKFIPKQNKFIVTPSGSLLMRHKPINLYTDYKATRQAVEDFVIYDLSNNEVMMNVFNDAHIKHTRPIEEYYNAILGFIREHTTKRIKKLTITYKLSDDLDKKAIERMMNNSSLDAFISKKFSTPEICDLRGIEVSDGVTVQYSHEILKKLLPVIVDEETDIKIENIDWK